MNKNCLREIRESLMISKAELSRKANIAPATITRIEDGMSCRIETQRRIILAFGYEISDSDKIFASVINDNYYSQSATIKIPVPFSS